MSADSNTLHSPLLAKVPGITHAFGTRAFPIPPVFADEWEQRPTKKQVHGTAWQEVTTPAQACGEVDSLWTRQRGRMIPIMGADCVPILMAEKNGRAVAGTHAGWRGTLAGALHVLWSELRSQGHDPHDWVAAIGPSIGPCCYETNPEIAEEFAQKFSRFGQNLAVPIPRFLDLPAINAAQLREIGVLEVDLLRACTRCTLNADQQPRFHSYRREGTGTRQWSVIKING